MDRRLQSELVMKRGSFKLARLLPMAEVDRRFDSEPQIAQRLLDALIRYLRAALPTTDEVIGTLGQQASLLHAYLEIEAIRSGGRLQGDIKMPTELQARPFAPAMILPLVALVAGGAAGSERETRVEVSASVDGGRLIVEVQDDRSRRGLRPEEESTLASLRQRLVALYGGRAELSFVMLEPRGRCAKIVINDPGSL